MTIGRSSQVDVADADQHDVFRIHFGRVTAQAGEFLGPIADEAGQRHAVDISAGDVCGVFMSECASSQITPELLTALPERVGHAADGADGHRVVAAEHQREAAARGGLFRPARPVRGRWRRCAADTRARVARVRALGLFHGDVAEILDAEAQAFDARVEVGDAQRRGSHVDAAAAGPDRAARR